MARQFTEFRSRQPNPFLPQVEEVDPSEVWEKREQIKIIDVRRPDEFDGELGHVPGSEMIVLDTLPQHLEELPKDQTLVMVCRSGNRSARAVAFLQENGFTSCYNMKGGMVLWNQLQLQVDRSEG